MVGVFDNEFDLLEAFGKVKSKGLKIEEVYTPYPIHEILEGMGTKTRITHAAFFFGLFGALAVLGGMYYAAVESWPLNFGGKPFNTFPSFIVVTIVATILIVTLLTLFTFSARAKVFPGKKAEIVDIRATDDKFVMVVDASSPGYDAEELTALLKASGASDVY
ncbi:DUF3341 domain-containing protein [Sunxiuqinia elliptica]|uniref:Quinol:cytochrome c oxidoreductase membrane protein n=1 Tax=Sunxiuqinia elliptica TaxID=655355 RepID=A0A4R6GME6_9BACT|nr:DUF3341 domain-containing protein [Sunxiuqinia elliptica]TDN96243.1 quinol:cytochrome c oxidoreductase membrane protein [Sunxiuqinia elliptica]TDO67954.1 quinol:cytochrome c oxidoreductase membrane protein [Sunxiuqinia elliptica]